MNRIEDRLKDLKKPNLSTEDRARMRSELLAYADLHAVNPIESPVAHSLRLFSMRLYAGLAAIMLVVVGGVGTAYASEDALPGDPLYTFKVAVSEPVQTALIPSERGKATWHAVLAERRLEEAAKLASEDKLTPETQEMLAVNLNTHIETSAEAADHLEQSGDVDGSLSARSDLEARLTAHEHILGVIASSMASSSAPTNMAVARLLAIVQSKEAAATTARIALEDHISPGTPHHPDQEAKAAGTVHTAAFSTLSAPVPEGFATTSASAKADTHARESIQQASTIRIREVEHILKQNAALLAKFLPATTTATSTATTTEETATTTEPAQ
jgi:hypothetical protein